MESTQNQAEATANKKKKKFVYLEKYESYKESTDERIRLMQKSINIGYAIMGILFCLIVLVSMK